MAPFLTRHFVGQLGESSQTFIYLSCLYIYLLCIVTLSGTIVAPNASATGGVRGGTGRREEDTTRERAEAIDVQLHSRSFYPNG